MPSGPCDSQDTLVIERPGLRVEFHWAGDRWGHTIVLEDGGSAPLSLRALDDPGVPRRVQSPVFQQLHIQTAPDGSTQALTMGESGPHRFSGGFSVHDTDGTSRLTVELADRCRAPLDRLVITYVLGRPLGAAEASEPTDRHVRLPVTPSAARLEALEPAWIEREFEEGALAIRAELRPSQYSQTWGFGILRQNASE